MITVEENDQRRLYNIGLMTNFLVLAMVGINLFFVFTNIYKVNRNRYLRTKNLKKEKERYIKLRHEVLLNI